MSISRYMPFIVFAFVSVGAGCPNIINECRYMPFIVFAYVFGFAICHSINECRCAIHDVCLCMPFDKLMSICHS